MSRASYVLFDFDIPNIYIRFAFERLLLNEVRASFSLEEDWEAGANPALPRNCKRGHSNRPLELRLWEGPLQEFG